MRGVLVIHRSERADPLVAALGEVLAHPSGDPFAPEVVAVPSRGVERWLAQRLSHVLGAGTSGDGVCANVTFPSSSQVLDDAVAAADAAYAASVGVWSAERAVWPLMTIIDEVVTSEAWARVLAVHLGDGRARRYAVGAKLARLFASYGAARPAMLRDWRDGGGEPLPADLAWQPELWRRLRDELGPGPAELLPDACARIREDPRPIDLPRSFSIFGVTRLSPSRVEVLDALAEHREIHLWLNHPSPALWRAVTEPAGRRADSTLRVTNPLLASLSRDVAELQQLLSGPDMRDEHHPMGERPPTLLGRLQTGLAEDTVEQASIEPGDDSLSVHACHGPARQIEVVRETVLGLLARDDTLEPRDIVIMCPDVEAYAPLIAASFGMAPEPGGHPAAALRVKLADRSLRQTNPMLSLLTQLLELAAHRVTATEVLDLAGAAPVRHRFGFTDDDIETLREWTSGANARWGLDAQHRAPYGLGGLGQGTWRAAIDRLLLGVTMEEHDQWLGSVLPLDDVDSGAIDLAGRFAELLDRVDTAVRAFEEPRPVTAWTQVLAEHVLALGEPIQPWQAVQLRGELADVAEAASETDVLLTRADVSALLDARLAGRPTRASFRTGSLTVCSLVPMRSVPHRVVCLVGMDDGAFPRTGVVDGDDLLARDPRTGERDVRSEDRQLFLDAICAAQEHLVITYTGADPRSGAEIPPCVPLGELLDALDATAEHAREQVVRRHPLQPFDPRNFEHGSPFSFDPTALAGARKSVGPRSAPRELISGELAAAEDATIELEELVRFLANPVRGFVQQRLKISTWQDDDDPNDALPVDVGGLPAWSIGSRVLRNRLAGMSIESCQEVELRRGDLPPGRIGQRVLTEVGNTVEALLVACAGDRGDGTSTSRDVRVPLEDGRTVTGTVVGLYGSALLGVTYSSLGPKQRLESWLRYLALVASGDPDPALRAVCVGKAQGGARRIVVSGIGADEARGVLADLVALRDLGLRSPLPLPLKTSERFATRRFDGRSEADSREAARSYWAGGRFDGECVEAAHELVLGARASFDALLDFAPSGRDELRFAPLAVRMWTPLLSAEAAS
ncbi:MAG: exodeoxyribonuclease V subunit gamma [Jatrophihabitans sp.]